MEKEIGIEEVEDSRVQEPVEEPLVSLKEKGVPIPSFKMFSTFSRQDKNRIVAQACGYFPELFGKNLTKYNRYVVWLVTEKNIVTSNARDGFSAGGQVRIRLSDGSSVRVPAIIGRLRKYRNVVKRVINEADTETLEKRWGVDHIEDDRIGQWVDLCVEYAKQGKSMDYDKAEKVFTAIFA